ncbi:MAG: 3'(2'),5'-bisphosphate nucleotidase CysQ [Alphaproteobacteria bacterium MarineAlpha5_Bin9]|nr:MAG: 3'(2'),5'-bisphosphate nucleotidase CysQ [Alphaproteobacteria bacterium MarineAlpha5_Bin9]|tara:strand:- start:8022 stop:8834 length:813 start_codon:yes stop_codon:yes gene_type:complete
MKKKDLIFLICNIAFKAGLIINKFYYKKINVAFKNDKSPLTDADIASNNFIINSLLKLNLKIPILSEESYVEWRSRKSWNKYWLIDPLDGTKEFLNKNGEFTVNIALIEKNKPILGVIYAPAKSLLYYASKKFGSYKLKTNKRIINFDKSIKIKIPNKKKSKENIAILSKSHNNKQTIQWLHNNLNKFKTINKGSSLKFCDVAEGIADIYPRFSPTSEWDIAAGQIILEEAGGYIRSINNCKINYNLKESIINSSFIASSKQFFNYKDIS